jgi:exonuclease SbcD
MKILHTADWHLGKRLEKFSRLQEQVLVMQEIVTIADKENVDAVIIAGDLFDNFNPATEAVDLFYKTLKRLSNNGKRAVIAIAGNHDSPERIEAPDPLARECGIIFAGFPHSHISSCELDSGVCISKSEPGFIELKLPGYEYPLRLLLTPYANEYRLKSFLGLEDTDLALREVLAKHWQSIADRYCDQYGVNMLVAHLYLMKKGEEPPEEPEDEKPILHVGGAQAIYSENIPHQMQYTALGHLHRFQQIDKVPCPVVYCSSPLSYSFSEAGQKKYVVIIEAFPQEPVSYRKVELNEGKTLFRKKFHGVDAAIEWLLLHPNTLVELTLVTESYLKADERKRLNQAHQGIVSIIPEVTNSALTIHKSHAIDMGQNLEELFIQYFRHKHGNAPNENLLNLFKEVRAESTEE